MKGSPKAKKKKTTKKFTVKIVWGSAQTREDNGDEAISYEFASKAELKAFLEGVEEGCGWTDYDIVEDEK